MILQVARQIASDVKRKTRMYAKVLWLAARAGRQARQTRALKARIERDRAINPESIAEGLRLLKKGRELKDAASRLRS